MIDDHDLFERAVERFAPPERSFERLVTHRDRKHRNKRITAGVLALVVAAAGTGALVRAFPTGSMPANPPEDPSVSPVPGTTEPDPMPDDATQVRGWPDTTRNPPGVYSWDGSRCASPNCIMGFMHNGYGSGDVDIRIKQVPEGGITDGATAATVAGHDGMYRRIDAQREEWIFDIEGTAIAIRLNVRPPASQADVADAQAIIGSMRTEPRNNDLGFRLVFTLRTNDWDSG